MKDLDLLSYFLWIEVARSAKGFFVSKKIPYWFVGRK